MKRRIQHQGKTSPKGAFTLVELLVACATLSLLLVLMLKMVNQTSLIWRSANTKIEVFQNARRSFDVLTALLSQATLNTYWGYDDASDPRKYIRKSELHCVVAPCGNGMPGRPESGNGVYFQAPANWVGNTAAYGHLTGLLNPCGFYVDYGSDAGWLPDPPIRTTARDRYRLMFWLQESDESSIFFAADDTSDTTAWIAPQTANTYPLADNIIALVIWPRDQNRSASWNSYSYNSRTGQDDTPQPVTANQLPPILEVAMVAIDENSALRLGEKLETTISDCLKDLFSSDPRENFGQDLKTLEGRLAEKRINYRVFSSSLPMREAKWSPGL